MNKPLPTILQNIIATKHEEVAVKSKQFPLELIEYMIAENNVSSRNFHQKIADKVANNQNAVIAEIKKASPSKGVICSNFNPEYIAKSYEDNGATCLSVLTDEQYFQGSEIYLQQARNITKLPVLRKDFIINEYQVFESKAMEADCILLIAACLNRNEIERFANLAYELDMDVLVEVHTLDEIEKIAGLPIRLIGINNRNLHTFEVNLNISIDLKSYIPDNIIIVTESGIDTKQDITLMNSKGINAFLVGETFMKHDNPGKKLYELYSE